MKLSDIITRQLWADIWKWLVTFLLKGKTLPSWTWHVVTLVGQWIYRKLVEYIDKVTASNYKKKRAAAQEKAKEEFDKVKNDPNASADEFGNKFQDMINAGKDGKK